MLHVCAISSKGLGEQLACQQHPTTQKRPTQSHFARRRAKCHLENIQVQDMHGACMVMISVFGPWRRSHSSMLTPRDGRSVLAVRLPGQAAANEWQLASRQVGLKGL